MIDFNKPFKVPPGDEGTGGHRAGFPWTQRQLETAERIAKLVPAHRRYTAVQAGGNVGMFPWVFAFYFKNVITFEPDPQNFECLLANLNGLTNVRAAHAALGANPGKRVMCHNVTNSGASFLEPREKVVNIKDIRDQSKMIDVVPLDYLHMESCDLLQLDVEGYEMFALKGAVNTIRLHEPLIVLEINSCCDRYQYTRADLDSTLAHWGYSLRPTLQMGNDHVYAKPHHGL